MKTATELKAELTRIVDDTSITSANQLAFVNLGYKQIRRDIVEARKNEFESVKTTITITSGIGPMPTDFLKMIEVQDADENTIPKLKRNMTDDDLGGGSILFWYHKGRSAAAGHTRQIGIKPLITTSLYVYYVPNAADLAEAAGELFDIPDEKAQRIGLRWSAYEYYMSKRRWSDSQNCLALYSAELQNYLEDFVDDEPEYIGDDHVQNSRFNFTN